MSKIYSSIDQLIGHTPLLELSNIERTDGLRARVLVKLERSNPAGSAKDRVALSMIEAAEREGAIRPHEGYTIIEPTSGTNPAPMPWMPWGPGLPPESTGESAGSTATSSIAGFCSLR